MYIPSFIVISYCLSELYGHICPHCNVLPEVVYCSFTRTTLFTELFTYFLRSKLRVASTSPSSVAPVSEIAKCIA